MKSQSICRAVLTLLLSCGFNVMACGQSDQSIVAIVPFAFSVQQHQFLAGSYVIETLQHGYIRMRGQGDASLIVHVTPNYSHSNRSSDGKLVFLRYGNEYFLRQAWIPSSDFGMNLPSTSQEISLAKASCGKPTEVAVRGH